MDADHDQDVDEKRTHVRPPIDLSLVCSHQHNTGAESLEGPGELGG